MPFPAEKNSDVARGKVDLKKCQSSPKHAEGEPFGPVGHEGSRARILKKTGIPRVKPVKPMSDSEKAAQKKRTPLDEKRANEDKSGSDDKGKKSGSVIMDKQLMNRKAQRAKGTTAIAKLSVPMAGRQSRQTSSADHISRPVTREEDDQKDDEPGMKIKVANKSSPPKLKRRDSKEENISIGLARKPAWITEPQALEEKKKMDKGEEEIKAKEEPAFNRNILQSSEPIMPSSTCSFFEKLQQGVRAYFSRNSIRGVSTPEESAKTNLTEGGMKVVGVASRVEEDREKRKAKVLGQTKSANVKLLKPYKNGGGNVVNSGKDLSKRHKLAVRGQILSIFDARLNIDRQFRVMIRRKLYHPKKHYVRIQIPRKGYFYRSYVHPKVLRDASYLPTRVEPESLQKSEQEIQIPGLAASSAKISNILQKGLNARAETRAKTKCRDECQMNFNYERLEKDFGGKMSPTSIRVHQSMNSNYLRGYPDGYPSLNNNGLVSLQFDQGQNNEPSLVDWPDYLSYSSDQEVDSRRDGRVVLVDSEDSEDEMRVEREAVVESYEKPGRTHANVRDRADGTNVTDSSSGNYESSLIKVETFERLDPTERGEYDEPVAFRVYNGCRGLTEMPSINNNNNNNINNSSSSSLSFAGSSVRAFSEQQYAAENATLADRKWPKITPVQPDVLVNSRSIKYSGTNGDEDEPRSISYACHDRVGSAETPAIPTKPLLMADIDLHMELQNYLKSISSSEGVTEDKSDAAVSVADVSVTNDETSDSFHAEPTTLSVDSDTNNAGTSSFTSASSTYINCCGSVIQLSQPSQSKLLSETWVQSVPGQESGPIENTNLKRNKSENDFCIEFENEQNTRRESCVKLSLGLTSFPVPQSPPQPKELVEFLEDVTSIEPVQFGPVDSCTDLYEKIKPLLKRTTELGTSSRNHFLCKNNTGTCRSGLKGSIVSDSAKPNDDDGTGDRTNFQQDQTVEDKKQVEQQTSLEHLTEIYNSVLKDQNLKLKNRKKSLNNVSMSLLSFVDTLLNLKKNKSEFTRMPEIKNVSVTQGKIRYAGKQWRGGQKNTNVITLEDYVNMVQEMLSSNLSMNQISLLNDITAGLQEKAKNNGGRKTAGKKDERKNAGKHTVTKKTREFGNRPTKDAASKNGPANTKPEPRKIILKNKSASSVMEKAKLQTKTGEAKKRLQLSKRTKSKMASAKPPLKVDENDTAKRQESDPKLDLSSPDVLESLLKAQFTNRDLQTMEGPVTPSSDRNNKLLVSVELCGEKVLVSSLKQIKNERDLDVVDGRSSGTSDLIIENVQRYNAKKKSLKTTLSCTSNQPQQQQQQQQQQQKTAVGHQELKEQKTKSYSLKKGKSLKSRNKGIKSSEERREESEDRTGETATTEKENLTEEEVEEENEGGKARASDYYLRRTTVPYYGPLLLVNDDETEPFGNSYEYDQERLKAQHPIEAIVESSESKLDELVNEGSSELEKNHEKVRDESDLTKKEILLINGVPMNTINLCDLLRGMSGPVLTKKPPRDVSPGNLIKGFYEKKLNRAKLHAGGTKPKSNYLTVSRYARSSGQKCSKSAEDTSYRKIAGNMASSFICYSLTEKVNNNKAAKSRKGSSESQSPETSPNSGQTSGRNDATPTLENPDLSREQSIEFLFNDRRENLSSNSPSDFEESLKSVVCTEAMSFISTQGSVQQQQQEKPLLSQYVCTSRSSFASVGKPSRCDKDLPVFIFRSRRGADDVSYPSDSDSYLESRSAFALTENELKSFFESSSDVKFFPGRITDTGEEQQPFVTFVLTPKQKATAGIPSNQVVVVAPKGEQVSPPRDDANDETSLESVNETTSKLSLRSIEQFIRTMSNYGAGRDKKKPKNSKKSSSDTQQQRKSKPPNAPPRQQIPKITLKRKGNSANELRSLSCQKHGGKMYHECQRLKQAIDHGKKPLTRSNDRKTQGKSKSMVLTADSPEVSKTNENKSSATMKNAKEQKDVSQVLGELRDEPTPAEDQVELCGETNKYTPEVLKLVTDVITVVANFKQKSEVAQVLREYAKLMKTEEETADVEDATKRPAETEPEPEPEESYAEEKEIKSIDLTPTNLNDFTGGLKTCEIGICCDLLKTENATETVEKVEKETQVTTGSGNDELTPDDDLPVGEDESNSGFCWQLCKKPSAYFDAVDNSILMEERHRRPTSDVSVDTSVFDVPDEADDGKDFPSGSGLTEFDASLISRRQQMQKVEGKIIERVMSNLLEENVDYAVKLLEAFLKKPSHEKGNDSAEPPNLRRALQAVEDKGLSLKLTMEKNAWLKVLNRLDDVALILSRSNAEEAIDKIQEMELAQPEMAAGVKYLEKEVYESKKLMCSLRFLKRKAVIDEELEKLEGNHGDNQLDKWKIRTDLVNLKVFSTIGDSLRFIKQKVVSNIRDLQSVKLWPIQVPENPEESQRFYNARSEASSILLEEDDADELLDSLRLQIRQKRLHIQYLMRVGCGPVFPEVEAVKSAVFQKFMSLEKALAGLCPIR